MYCLLGMHIFPSSVTFPRHNGTLPIFSPHSDLKSPVEVVGGMWDSDSSDLIEVLQHSFFCPTLMKHYCVSRIALGIGNTNVIRQSPCYKGPSFKQRTYRYTYKHTHMQKLFSLVLVQLGSSAIFLPFFLPFSFFLSLSFCLFLFLSFFLPFSFSLSFSLSFFYPLSLSFRTAQHAGS